MFKLNIQHKKFKKESKKIFEFALNWVPKNKEF